VRNRPLTSGNALPSELKQRHGQEFYPPGDKCRQAVSPSSKPVQLCGGAGQLRPHSTAGMSPASIMSWLGASLFALAFLATDVNIAQRRLFWYDEIGTLDLIKLPDVKELWQAQNALRGDSAPTLYLLLVRLVYAATGHAEVSVRLISAVAMMVTLLVVFDCARRLTDGPHGLIAMFSLASSFFTYYGYEGRPYALATLFMALALWLWIHTKQEGKGTALAFGAAIFAAVSMHFNSILIMVPFGFWEVYRWRPGRKPSAKFLAGVIGLATAIGLAAPQVRIMYSVGRLPASSWSAPSFAALVRVLSHMFPPGLFVLAVFVMLRCLMPSLAKPMADSEKLCWLFLLIPAAGFVLAEAVTNSFYSRYLIATMPGVVVGFGCLAARHLTRPASTVLLLLLSGIAVGRQFRDARGAEAIEPQSAADQQLHTRQALAVEDILMKDGRTTVLTEHTVVRALRYYSKHPELYVSYGPNDAAYFCLYLGEACWGLDKVKAHAGELASIYPSDTFLSAMLHSGYQARVKMTNPMVVYFSLR